MGHNNKLNYNIYTTILISQHEKYIYRLFGLCTKILSTIYKTCHQNVQINLNFGKFFPPDLSQWFQYDFLDLNNGILLIFEVFS